MASPGHQQQDHHHHHHFQLGGNNNENSNNSSKKGISSFTPTHLDTIDSEAPTIDDSHNSGVWDTETDHILSYFLGGGDGHSHAVVPTADFASTVASSADRQDDEHRDSAAWQMPPPTPAIQFYSHTPHTGHRHHSHQTDSSNKQDKGHHSQQQHQHSDQPITTNTSQTSSSSSLSSMNAALVHGMGMGPNVLFNTQLHRTKQHQSLTPTDVHNESPLSPAAMIGIGENLLLPGDEASAEAAFHVMPAGNSSQQHQHGADPSWHHSANTSTTATPQTNKESRSSNVVKTEPQEPKVNGAPVQQISHAGVAVAPILPTHHHPQHFMYAAAAASAFQNSRPPPVETEEKRAKRLERNRESARKSRRRKKERLVSLEAQVNKLHNEIETLRRDRINAMVHALKTCRVEEIKALQEEEMSNDSATEQEMVEKIIQGSGPSSQIMRSVLDFQYTMLKRLTLPSHEKFLLWLTLRDEKYFMAAKEQYAAKQLKEKQKEEQKQSKAPTEAVPARSTTPKVSSKQIGDELTNGKPDPSNNNKKKSTGNKTKTSPTAAAYEATKLWPLFCYELKFSVDQEDRFLAKHRSITEGQSRSATVAMANCRTQMHAAVNTIESLSKAVGTLAHLQSNREQRMFLGTLNSKQVIAFHDWLDRGDNRNKCQLLKVPKTESNFIPAPCGTKEVTLQDICRKLNEVLRISSKDMNED